MSAALPFTQAAMPVLRLQAVYQGLPQTNRLTLSDFYLVPFHDDLDFESFSILGAARERPWPPVLLNYTQKYALMSKVLDALRKCCHGTDIVLNSRMPSTLRMPAAMLGDDIFVALDLEAEANRYLAKGHSVIAVHEALLRYATEEGRNELVVSWHLPPADVEARLRDFRQQLGEWGFDWSDSA